MYFIIAFARLVRRAMTMRVADDNASVACELLRVVSGLRCELVDRDVCPTVTSVASCSWMA